MAGQNMRTKKNFKKALPWSPEELFFLTSWIIHVRLLKSCIKSYLFRTVSKQVMK